MRARQVGTRAPKQAAFASQVMRPHGWATALSRPTVGPANRQERGGGREEGPQRPFCGGIGEALQLALRPFPGQ